MELRILLFASLVVWAVSSPVPPKQYRSDYEYNKNTDAFYKLHTKGGRLAYASYKCIEEGGELVKVTSHEDLEQVRAFIKKFPDLEASVLLASDGTLNSDNDSKNDCDVVTRNGEVSKGSRFQDRPFVCKVAAKGTSYNEECGVYSNGYELISTTGSCYRVSTVEATWDEAHANCQAEGAHLVILSSAEELEVLYNLLKDKPHDSETQYFAGVRADTTTEPRVFKTVLNQSLEEVEYGPWEEGEPNEYEYGENCVVLDTRRHGKYNDIVCHNKLPYVCEVSRTPLPAPSKVQASDAPYNKECGVYSNDYVSKISTTGSCYKVYTAKATWDEANANCQAEGAHLVILSSDVELKFLYNMLQEMPHDSETQYFAGVRADTTTKPKMFKTVLNQSLEEVGYGPWEEGEPNEYEYGENCVVLDTRRHGKYNDITCHNKLPYVCEVSRTPLAAPGKVAASDAPYNKECGVYSNDYVSKISTTGSCYKVYTAKATWDEANANCQAEGAHLVILSSDEELKFLYNMLQEMPHDSETQYFAGVRADTTTKPKMFKTVLNQSLEEVGYGPWEEGEPNEYEYGENCVVLDTRRHGKYNDIACHNKLPYVCEVSMTPLPAPSKVVASDAPYNKECGVYSNDYVSKISTIGSCYKVYTAKATWDEANTNCQAEGADLVILNSNEELKFLYNMLQEMPHDSETQYFAGVRADTTTKPKIFKTVLNQSLEEVGYGPWEEGEPNEYEYGENCVVLDTRRHGKYNDIACHNKLPYVCEVFRTPLPASSTPKADKQLPDVPAPPKQYRPDYEYNKDTDAFYKLHTEGTSKYYASEKCKAEGAELVRITSDEDLKQVITMMKKLSDLEDYVMVVLVSDVDSDEPRPDSSGPYSWNSECYVVNRQGKIETTTARQQLPFVCKVAANDAPYNKECGVYSNDYESRMSTTGSCYRVSTAEATWNEAHANCQAEGAHLVILSSDEELEVLYNMLKDKPHDSETQYFAGVRADTTTEPRVFKTALNQTLEDVGYGPWEAEEPNDYEGGENCVALDTRRHGKYNDVWCHVRMRYVCESSGAPLEIRATASTANSESTVSIRSKQYRSDYEYNKNTDAFYKLHTEATHINSAFIKCKEEGAALADIITDDVKQIQAMIKKFPDLKDSPVLVSSYVKSNYDGTYESYVLYSNGKVERHNIFYKSPFVCKVAAGAVSYNEECGVYSNGYESRISTTGSCYKVSTADATWDEANANCQAEGAHLVILNSDEELNILFNMLKEKPHNSETQYFAGVRAESNTEPRVFKTVLNQTLEEVGYGPWDKGEPNDYEGGENCVALDTRRHGKYNDVWCHVRMPYVCESSGAPREIKETPSTTNSVSAVTVSSKQYRPDYEYNKDTDAFYKLHTKSTTKMSATEKCKIEGAELAKITSGEDLKQIYAMMKKLSTLEDYVMVASDEDSGPYRWSPECKVVNRMGKTETTSSSQNLPFVCKVAASDRLYDEDCGVYSNDYESRISTTGSCYKVSTIEATWNEAHANCQAEGAHLVILNSEKELEVLYDMLKYKPHDSETQYFAGVRADTTTEPRVFKTVLNQTLEEVGYEPWDENEPNDYEGGENCVALDTRRHGKYNDVWCHVRMPYVCEISRVPLKISTTPSTPNSASVIPISSKQYRLDYEYNKNTDAFYKLHTKSISQLANQFDAAYAYECEAEGAELVNIASDEDLKQVHAMLKKLSDLEDYVMVAPDVNHVPYTVSYYECTVVNRMGKIEKTSADPGLPFVCKVAAKDAPYNKECGVYSNGYELISTTGSCYRVSTVEATWDEAHANCQAEGAHLVILSSDEELEVLYNLLKDKPHDSETQYFAGVRADTTTEPRVFKTVFNQSLEEVGYGPWEEGEPNEYEYGENCVVLDTRRHGKYNDIACHNKLPYVCEVSRTPLPGPSKVAASDAPYNKECGVDSNDYVSKISTTGSCYKVYTAKATWDEANANCQAEGAHLVILSSDEELKFLYNMLQEMPHDSETQYFAGVRADTTTKPKMFKTVLNQSLEEVGYGPWEEGEPNEYEYGENCVVLDTRRHGKYSDIVCHNKLPYVCEVSSVPVLSKQYRPDYEYNKNTDAFYKLHSEAANKYSAFSTCRQEGAKLAKISSDEDLKQIYTMMTKKLSDLEDLVMISAVVNVDNPESEGNVVNRRGKVEMTSTRQMLPFVCKVEAEDAPYNEECGVYSNDYESRISTTGSCYRVSTAEATWNEAHANCQAEGAHLVILSSDEELEVLYNMLKDTPHNSETQYFAGVRADTTTEPRMFKTVLNQTLEEVGYGPWDENEPNDYEGGENCVALDTRRHGKYNDVWCHVRMPYVCESSGAPSTIRPSPTTPVPDPVPSAVPPKRYRPGYEYNEQTDAFYKLHQEGGRKHDATAKCIEEGAELLKITSNEDLKQVRAMTKKIPNLKGPVIVASIEISEQLDSSYNNDVLNRNGEVKVASAYQELPFVCKVAAEDAPYNEECDVYSNDYVSRISTTGSCYRVSTGEASWDEAHANCQAEGAHLVILSSDEELEVLYKMLQEIPHNSETQYFAGVIADTSTQSRLFKTVFNQTLEEVGYGPWEKDEPNDYYSGEKCVALDTRRHGKYNDVWCYVRMPYVCEKTLTKIQSTSKSPDSSRIQRGVALSANVLGTLNFFFGPFSS